MRKQNLLAIAALVGLVSGMPAVAHHSAAQFDFGSQVQVKGLVKMARFSNPHAKIVLEVTDDARGTRDIEFEGHSRNNMYRTGLRPEMMNVGDTVTIVIAPMRNGEDGGYMTGFITADGERIGLIQGAD